MVAQTQKLIIMEKIKPIGMVHIKGVNDTAYAKYVKSLPKPEEQVMISIVNNRW